MAFVTAVLFALKNLILSLFREPTLIWQIAPILFLWIVLMFYFSTHKQEQLGWNTSLANGISLFWVIISALQYIFSNGREFFTWSKFILFFLITLYSLFIVYIAFHHLFSARITYVLASYNAIYYFSIISLLYAHDLIYLDIAMLIAIIILFGFILLIVRLLDEYLPEMREDYRAIAPHSTFADFDSTPNFFPKPLKSSKRGGVEAKMGKKNMSENHIKW